MKYFKKFLNFGKPYTLGFVKELLLVGIFALFGVSFCNITNADNGYGFTPAGAISIPAGNSVSDFALTGFYCLKANNATCNSRLRFYDLSGNLLTVNSNDTITTNTIFCFDIPITLSNGYSSNCQVYKYEIFKDIKTIFTGEFACPTCPTCEEQYTSLECQTEYNLIPISEVTENYCTSNFDLISPLDCPSSPSSGSGEVSRSALYVNNVQYNGAPNLYVNINDLLDYSMTYVSGSAVIDVDGYKADTGYMSDILTIQEYHPSSEDFTVAFVSVLTYALPYVIVALFVLFIWKLIKKIFKS